MIFSVNAWIDRLTPFISVQNTETGQEVARFEGEKLEVHLEQGSICVNDFCDANSHQQQLLAMDLLLLKCCDATQEITHREILGHRSIQHPNNLQP